MGSPRTVSRFISAPVQTPSTPGTGTGGGTGGGTTSIVKSDRYIGTLGSAAKAPVGSKFPNHLTFPAAEKYDWVKVTENATINGVAVSAGQTWICNGKTEKDLPENWEIRSKTISPETFGDEDSALYLGTLGLNKDKPTDAKRPHFNEFPAANAGDWVQVVSVYKTADSNFYNNFPVYYGEIWMCLEDNTPVENPEKWERVAQRPKTGLFEQLGYYFVGRYDFFEIPSDQRSWVSFNPNEPNRIVRAYGAGLPTLPQLRGEFVDVTSWKNYATEFNFDAYIDFQFVVSFEQDSNGDRSIELQYLTGYWANNTLTNNTAGLLDKQPIKASRDDETVLRVSSDKFLIPWVSPNVGATGLLLHGLGMVVFQTSGIPIKIRKLQLILGLYRRE